MATVGDWGRADSPVHPNESTSEQAVKWLLHEVDRQRLDYVRFTFADIHGIGRCKSVPRRHVEHLVRTGGVTVFAGQLIVFSSLSFLKLYTHYTAWIFSSLHVLPVAFDAVFTLSRRSFSARQHRPINLYYAIFALCYRPSVRLSVCLSHGWISQKR